MSFLKRRVTLSEFIKMIAKEVLKIPQHTYEDYLAIDPNSILSQSEFEEFIKNLPSLRRLLLYSLLIDGKNKGVFKFRMEDLKITFNQALQLSYQDNGFDQEEAQRLSEDFNQELLDFLSYLETISKEELSKDGYTAYACLHFTAKFTHPLEDNLKNGVLVPLINTQRMLMKGHFAQAVQKVKVI